MNMLLHGVKDTEFDIYRGDTLTNDWDMLRETNLPRSQSLTRWWRTRRSTIARIRARQWPNHTRSVG